MDKLRRTHFSQVGNSRHYANEIYIAEIKKIYEIPKKHTQKPKFLKDGLTDIYKNKSDLFDQG